MTRISAHQLACPVCRKGLEIAPLLHHMICAYVGPAYDFTATGAEYVCPKCRRSIVSGDDSCEIVGTSTRCISCGTERVLEPFDQPVDASMFRPD